MTESKNAKVSLEGEAQHSARIYQQGQGYQLNIDQAVFEPLAGLKSPWTEQFESWPLVRDLDPLELGVHRAPINGGNAVPVYVERDADAEIRGRLRHASEKGGLILLTGDSTAGKSRAAYEALLSVIPDRSLLRPFDQKDLIGSLPAVLSHQSECALWLDDLEQYIGPSGINSGAVAYLKRAKVSIIATMRGEQHRRFSDLSIGSPHDNHTKSDFKKMLDQCDTIFIPRKWTPAEVDRATQSPDSRVAEAVRHSDLFGVAEYMAAGPLLLDEWQLAWGAEMNPRGAGLIAAAVDCARAGIDDAIPKALLVDLHEIYLDAAGGELLQPEPLDAAISWATRRRSGVASPLIPLSNGEAFRAFDYLVDSLMRKDSEQDVPDQTWEKVLNFAKTHRKSLPGVASAARRHSRRNIEIASWQELADSGDSHGAIQLGSLYELEERADLALEWYEKAATLGDPEGYTLVGVIHDSHNEVVLAEQYFREAAEAGNRHGMNHLAMLLRDQQRASEAETWYRKAVDLGARHDVTFNLARLLGETGRLEEAEALYRKEITSGKNEAINILATLLSQAGRKDEAHELLLQGAEKGLGSSAARLALEAESNNNVDEAESWWRKAVDLGSESAIIKLAINLDTSRRPQAKRAERLFTKAIELQLPGAEYNFSIFLSRHDRHEEAEKWCRVAVEKKEENATKRLSSILFMRGETDEATEWWRELAKSGDVESQRNLGEHLCKIGQIESGQKWLKQASDAGDIYATCSYGWQLFALGNSEEAEQILEHSFKMGHAHAACAHGQVLLRLNKEELAADRFKAAYFAGHLHVAKDLEYIYRSLGHGKEAAEWLRRSKESYKATPTSKKTRKKRRRR